MSTQSEALFVPQPMDEDDFVDLGEVSLETEGGGLHKPEGAASINSQAD
jgi:hypothetical protein